MKPKSILLATLLGFAPACNDSEKFEACVTEFNETLSCHEYKVAQACEEICLEMTEICERTGDFQSDNPRCLAASSYCYSKCEMGGFQPDTVELDLALQGYTLYFYDLASCQFEGEPEMVCSDLTAP